MTLDELLENISKELLEEIRTADQYPRYWDKSYVSENGRKGIWRYNHRDAAGAKPGDGKIVHHKNKNEKDFDEQNLVLTDRAEHCRIEPNAKKYDENSKCKVKGCKKKPWALNMCVKHYMQNRRKEKS